MRANNGRMPRNQTKVIDGDLSDIDWSASDRHVYANLIGLGCSVSVANSLILRYHSDLLLAGMRDAAQIALKMVEMEANVLLGA